MTTVQIPPLTVAGLASDTGSVTLTVQLVTAGGRSVVAALASDGGPVQCWSRVLLRYPPDDIAPIELELTGNALVVAPDSETFYRFSFAGDRQQMAEWTVQVPDQEDPITLADLIAGVDVPEADILAGRLLTLVERAALSRANSPSDTNPIATIADVGSNVWYLSDDADSVTMAVGKAALVGETDIPYPIVTIQIEYEI